MEYNELVTVYTVNNSGQAQIIKNALNAEGIRCFIEGANQAGEAGLIGLEIKIQVPAESATQARKMIEAHEGHHPAQGHDWSEQRKGEKPEKKTWGPGER